MLSCYILCYIIYRAKVKGDQQAATEEPIMLFCLYMLTCYILCCIIYRAKVRGDEQAATAELVGAGPGRNSQKPLNPKA